MNGNTTLRLIYNKMRIVKFRIRNKNNGQWWYFDLWDEDIHKIHQDNLDKTTIGQFTGLLDKQGKEIYEGDICENGDWENDACAFNYRIEEVKYIEDEATFIGWNFNIDGMTCKVIGNIYENPELNY